jgi:protein translocase SecG subunit
MEFLETLFTVLQILSAIIVMILVLLQDSKEDGNIITGSSNQGGTMGASRNTKLAKLTKYVGIAFIIFTIASSTLMLINY